jgi:hypothetical protein
MVVRQVAGQFGQQTPTLVGLVVVEMKREKKSKEGECVDKVNRRTVTIQRHQERNGTKGSPIYLRR